MTSLAADVDRTKRVDVLVAGAGVLGVSVSYWLSSLFECRVMLVDPERVMGAHASSRNTGVLHRPYYLDPRSKRVFARSADLSWGMWKELARRVSAPWSEVGTLDVAVEDADVSTLERYKEWGEQNGMARGELVFMSSHEVSELEPEVSGRAGLYVKDDVSVDFGYLTRALGAMAAENGVDFEGGMRVTRVENSEDGLSVVLSGPHGSPSEVVRCGFMVNVAGGGALPIAHSRGLAKDCSVLNFRGDYWVVRQPFASRVRRNIYTPPRYPRFPFLDPHFVVKADGTRQIGPNAALVTGPYVYEGVGIAGLGRLLSAPMMPKLRLLSDLDVVAMAMDEWRSSTSKRAMCSRVARFIPGLKSGELGGRGVSGVRCSLVNAGGFVPEALVLNDERSMHVLNYNSPGATGAPSFSAMLVARLMAGGHLDWLRRRAPVPHLLWDFESTAGELGL